VLGHFIESQIMKQYFVYILLCSDNSYYTGITNDLDRRLYDHKNGIDPKAYTFKRRPVKMVFQEMFSDVNQAIAFEKQVKGWRRAKKEAIIRGDWELLPGLSKNNM
jgi:putative endonuclease